MHKEVPPPPPNFVIYEEKTKDGIKHVKFDLTRNEIHDYDPNVSIV